MTLDKRLYICWLIADTAHRKRAKTEAEKEQRRIERVLRNRAAAQASRERRRKELEELEEEKADLEKDNDDLKSRLNAFEEDNAQLAQRVKEMEDQLRSFQETIKIFQQMGGSFSAAPLNALPTPSGTSPIDLSSLLPTPERQQLQQSQMETESLGMAHQSAALMCDLQCQPSTQNLHQRSLEMFAIWMMQCILLETMTSTLYSVQMPFLQLFLSLKKGTPISNADLIRFFPLIRWLVLTKPTRQLRQRLLTCSPALALLSKAATGRALWQQLVRGQLDQFGQGMAVGEGEANELDPASECRRIVRELQNRAGDDGGPKFAGTANVEDIQQMVGALWGKTREGRGN
jgi:transcriptional activator HAC1